MTRKLRCGPTANEEYRESFFGEGWAMYELISDELHDKYTAVQDAGGSVDEFLAAYAATRGITSDKDRAGNTIALSKARKMKKAIDAAVPDAPKKVRRALYSAFGVSKSVWY